MNAVKKRKANAGWFKQGYDPRRARGGGVKGVCGRKPDPWYALMRRAPDRQSVLRNARRVIRDGEHPAWVSCYKWVAEQAFGKVRRPRAVASGPANLAQLIARDGKHERGA